jgi:hypothetical protein
MRISANLLVWLMLLSGRLALSQVKFTSTAYTSGDIGTKFDCQPISITMASSTSSLVNTGTLAFYKGLGGGKFASPVSQPIPANLGQV